MVGIKTAINRSILCNPVGRVRLFVLRISRIVAAMDEIGHKLPNNGQLERHTDPGNLYKVSKCLRGLGREFGIQPPEAASRDRRRGGDIEEIV